MSRWRQIVAVMVAGLMAFPALAASHYPCNDKEKCGLLGDGAYDNLVIGTIVHVADIKESAEIFQWARSHGYWKTLPDDAKTFSQKIQVLSVAASADGKQRVTLLGSKEDFVSSQAKVGDFVRYQPHNLEFLAEKKVSIDDKDAYWKLHGCVAVLCSAEDPACFAGYQPGIYRRADGVPLDPATGEVNKTRLSINPQTYIPIKPAADH